VAGHPPKHALPCSIVEIFLATTTTTSSGAADAAVRGVLAFATIGGFGWALGACWRGLLWLFWFWIARTFWSPSPPRWALGAIWLWGHVTTEAFRYRVIQHLGLEQLNEQALALGLVIDLKFGEAWLLRVEAALTDDALKTLDAAQGLIVGGMVGLLVMVAYTFGWIS
jgi:hypothetical protein